MRIIYSVSCKQNYPTQPNKSKDELQLELSVLSHRTRSNYHRKIGEELFSRASSSKGIQIYRTRRLRYHQFRFLIKIRRNRDGFLSK